MTTVILSDDEAKQFIAFQKNYELFLIMQEKGALDVGYGKVIVNFAAGIMQNVTVEEVVWRR